MNSSPQSETNFVQGAQLGGGFIAVPLTVAFGTPDTLTGTLPALSDTLDDPSTCRVFRVVASLDIASSSNVNVKIGGVTVATFTSTTNPYVYRFEMDIMYDPARSVCLIISSLVGTGNYAQTQCMDPDLAGYTTVPGFLRAGTSLVIEFTGDNSTNNGGFIIGG